MNQFECARDDGLMHISTTKVQPIHIENLLEANPTYNNSLLRKQMTLEFTVYAIVFSYPFGNTIYTMLMHMFFVTV